MLLSSVVQLVEFSKNNQFWFFFNILDSENHQLWFFVKNENQRAVVDSSYFKNTKEEPTIVRKEPTIL
jgi:hypothetical protein